jgi:hypothetical protein
MDDWCVRISGLRYDRVSPHLQANDLLWRPGFEGWRTVRSRSSKQQPLSLRPWTVPCLGPPLIGMIGHASALKLKWRDAMVTGSIDSKLYSLAPLH